MKLQKDKWYRHTEPNRSLCILKKKAGDSGVGIWHIHSKEPVLYKSSWGRWEMGFEETQWEEISVEEVLKLLPDFTDEILKLEEKKPEKFQEGKWYQYKSDKHTCVKYDGVNSGIGLWYNSWGKWLVIARDHWVEVHVSKVIKDNPRFKEKIMELEWEETEIEIEI